MNYIEFNAGDKVYKLRLNTRNIVALEKKIGCNPLAIFGEEGTIPKVSVLVSVFHAALQQLNHGITENDAFDIYDEWIAEGHNTVEFVTILLELYKVSGLVPNTTDGEEGKN